MRRHDLIWIRPLDWHAVTAGYENDRLVRGWVARDWPLIRRQPLAGEGPGITLGLPTPPFDGKRRLAFLIPPEAVARVAPPPALDDASPVLPGLWQWTAARLSLLGDRHDVVMRIVGSAAFQFLTGLDYLTPASDLDLLIEIGPDTDIAALAADLAQLAEQAPMRIDGEIMGKNGAAFKWRELARDPGSVLIRTAEWSVFDTPLAIRSAEDRA